jgi:cytochrome oxidase Cu insertion factor (SCO1/SenC/PrrC family)
MKSAAFALWMAILATAAVGYGGWWAYQRMAEDRLRFPEGAERAARPAAEFLAGKKPHFSLTERSEKTFDTQSLDGKVWVVTFFYSTCPGPCLRQKRALQEVQRRQHGRDVHIVSITCDPAIDTPDVLQRYAAQFNADPEKWLFLTGKFEAIQEIAKKQFLLPFDKQIHSERAIVIDHTGQIRDVFDTLDTDDMQRMTQLLIDLDDAAKAAKKS